MTDTLKYRDYIASIHFSNDDDVFYGKVIGINDLIIFQGTSVKQLKKEFKEVIDDYIQTCKDLKKEPNKTYKGSFNIRIPSDLHRKAALYSSLEGISLNDFVRLSIEYTLSNKGIVNEPNDRNIPIVASDMSFEMPSNIGKSPYIACANEAQKVYISQTQT